MRSFCRLAGGSFTRPTLNFGVRGGCLKVEMQRFLLLSFASRVAKFCRSPVSHRGRVGHVQWQRRATEGGPPSEGLRGAGCLLQAGGMPSGIVCGQPRRRLCVLGAVPQNREKNIWAGLCLRRNGLWPRAAARSHLPKLDLQRVLAPGFVSGASRAASARLARCPAADQGCWSACKSRRLPCFLPGVGRLPCFYPRLGNGRAARPNNVKTTLIQRFNATFAQLGR